MIAVNKVDKMRYQSNSLSFLFCILSIIANACYFISIYRNNALSYTYFIGADVVMNIVFMLIAFLAAEKGKAYAKSYAFVMLVLGVIEFLRILFLPMHYHNLGELVGKEYTLSIIFLSAAGVLMLVAGVVCYVKSTKLINYLKSIDEVA